MLLKMEEKIMENDYFNENEFIFNKNYSISASAGTGKTYSIVKIITEKKYRIASIL